MHIPVLLQEAVEYLNVEKNKNYIDATGGLGGHSEEILKRNYPKGKVLIIDLDNQAIKVLKEKFTKEIKNNRVIIKEGNYKNLLEIAKEVNFKEVDGVLFDLGMSKMNLENSNRGFSFNRNEPLLMTYSDNASYTAYDFVNYESFEKIRNVLRNYGEEWYASRIAKKIIEKRKIKKIETSLELSQLIEEIYPKRNLRIHPATKTFQAIRIYVNDELNNLVRGLDGAFKLIETGGTIVVLSYHSLEDRIVKKFFKQKESEKVARILTKKPIIPTLKEINLNPSSRSAKLRAIKKIK